MAITGLKNNFQNSSGDFFFFFSEWENLHFIVYSNANLNRSVSKDFQFHTWTADQVDVRPASDERIIIIHQCPNGLNQVCWSRETSKWCTAEGPEDWRTRGQNGSTKTAASLSHSNTSAFPACMSLNPPLIRVGRCIQCSDGEKQLQTSLLIQSQTGSALICPQAKYFNEKYAYVASLREQPQHMDTR